MKIQLTDGKTGFWNDRSEFIVTGSQNGRADTLPDDLPMEDWQPGRKLRLMQLPLDSGGAYWGTPNNLWIATQGAKSYAPDYARTPSGKPLSMQQPAIGFHLIPCGVTVYLRATTRHEAKQAVLKLVPDARFYH